jgi:hypothetical protein
MLPVVATPLLEMLPPFQLLHLFDPIEPWFPSSPIKPIQAPPQWEVGRGTLAPSFGWLSQVQSSQGWSSPVQRFLGKKDCLFMNHESPAKK